MAAKKEEKKKTRVVKVRTPEEYEKAFGKKMPNAESFLAEYQKRPQRIDPTTYVRSEVAPMASTEQIARAGLRDVAPMTQAPNMPVYAAGQSQPAETGTTNSKRDAVFAGAKPALKPGISPRVSGAVQPTAAASPVKGVLSRAEIKRSAKAATADTLGMGRPVGTAGHIGTTPVAVTDVGTAGANNVWELQKKLKRENDTLLHDKVGAQAGSDAVAAQYLSADKIAQNKAKAQQLGVQHAKNEDTLKRLDEVQKIGYEQNRQMRLEDAFASVGQVTDAPVKTGIAPSEARRLAWALQNARQGIPAHFSTANGDEKFLELMTPEEKNAIIYYAQAGDESRLEAFYKDLYPDLTAREYDTNLKKINAPDTGNVFVDAYTKLSRMAQPLIGSFYGPGAYAENAMQAAKNAMAGEYEPTNMNTGSMARVRYGNAAQQKLTENAGPVEGFLTNVTYSILDNASKLPLGPLALPIIALGAGGQTAVDALERGATPAQAFTVSTAAVAVEALTEKIPIDNLFRIAKSGGKGLREAVIATLKHAGIETSEETISEYMNTLIDMATMGDKSQFALYKSQLMADGASEEHAQNLATLQFFAINPGLAGLGGGISGGAMGGAANVIGALNSGASRDGAADAATRGVQVQQAPAADVQTDAAINEQPARGSSTNSTFAEAQPDAIPAQPDFGYADVDRSEKDAISDFVRRNIPDATDADIAAFTERVTGAVPAAESNQTADTEFVEKAAEKFGVNIRVGDVRSAQGDRSGAEAVYDRASNTITISPNASRAEVVRGVLMHEITHSIEDSDAYTPYRTFVFRQLGYAVNSSKLDADIKAKRRAYAAQGVQLNDAGAVREIVADYTRNTLFADTDAVNKMVQDRPALARRFLNWIRNTLNKARLWLSDREGYTELLNLEKGRALFERALGEKPSVTGSSVQAEQYSLTTDQIEVLYQKYLDEFGTLEEGEPPRARDIKVPAQTSENNRTSRWARTVAESAVADDQSVTDIKQAVVENRLAYTPWSDAKAIKDANRTVERGDANQLEGALRTKIGKGERFNKGDVALGERLIQEAIKRGDYEAANSLIIDVSLVATEMGQSIQALSLLKRLTPEGQLMAVQRTVERMNNNPDKRMKKAQDTQSEATRKKAGELRGQERIARENGGPDKVTQAQEQVKQARRTGNHDKIKSSEGALKRAKNAAQRLAELQKEIAGIEGEYFVPQANVEDILSQTTPEGTQQAVERAIASIAQQRRATWADKVNAWRYLSMLGNPRTHIRNFIGNVVFVPAVKLKNMIGVAGERAFVKKGERTKAVLTAKDAPLIEYARADFEKMKDTISSGGKYDMRSQIVQQAPVFRFKPLESARKANSAALEWEDVIFMKHHYVSSLAQYMKANGLDAKSINADQLQSAQKYATTEAQKATYRDFNIVANWLNQVSQNSKIASVLVEGALPFKKTPANIIKRGVEYSPVGIAKGLYDAATQIKSGNKTPAQVVDALASGLSGTALLVLGYFLAQLGWISAGERDEKRKAAFDRNTGDQEYAIILPDGSSYTIDWMAPSVMPLMVGAEMRALFTEERGEPLSSEAFINAVGRITEPAFDLTMLDSVTSALQSYSQEGVGQATNVITNAAASFAGQFIPTLGGQVARTIDPVRRSTSGFSDGGIAKESERVVRSAVSKVPGATQHLQPVINQRGEEVQQPGKSWLERLFLNMASPGSYRAADMTNTDRELARLFEVTGETDVLPKSVPRSFTYDNVKYTFTAEEYTQFARTMGKTAYEELDALVSNPRYKTATDEDRTTAVIKIMDKAMKSAKTEFLMKRGVKPKAKK